LVNIDIRGRKEETVHEEVGKAKERLAKIGNYALVAEIDTLVKHPEISEECPEKLVF